MKVVTSKVLSRMEPSYRQHHLGSSRKADKIISTILIAANIIPLIGVLFYQWDLTAVMLLYWLENIVIGIINVLRLLFLANDSAFYSRLPSIFFFICHYGIFCAAHGTLLFELLELDIEGFAGAFSPLNILAQVQNIFIAIYLLVGDKIILALFAMVLSHTISLIYHYFLEGERYQLTVAKVMKMPYKRIMALHIGLIAGAFLLEKLGSPIYLLSALVAAKIFVDVFYHRKEHHDMVVQG